MRVLIGDTIYNVNRVIYPNCKGNILLVYVVLLDLSIACYSVECCSDYYATNIFYEILTSGYSDLNSYKVKEITFKR